MDKLLQSDMQKPSSSNAALNREPQQADDSVAKSKDSNTRLADLIKDRLDEFLAQNSNVLDVQGCVFSKVMSYAEAQSPGCGQRVCHNDAMAFIMSSFRCMAERVEVKTSVQGRGEPLVDLTINHVAPLGFSSKTRAMVRSGPCTSDTVKLASAVESIAKAAQSVVSGNSSTPVKASSHTEKKTRRKAVGGKTPKGGARKKAPTNGAGPSPADAAKAPLSDVDKARRRFLQSCLRSAKSPAWKAILTFYKKGEDDIRAAVQNLSAERVTGADLGVPPLERLGIIDLMALPEGASWADSADVDDQVAELVRRARARFVASARPKPVPATKETFIRVYKDLGVSAPESYADAVKASRLMLKRSLGMEDAPLVSLKYIKETGERSVYMATWKSHRRAEAGSKVYTFLAFLRQSMRSGPSVDVVQHPDIPSSDWIPHSRLSATQIAGSEKSDAKSGKG